MPHLRHATAPRVRTAPHADDPDCPRLPAHASVAQPLVPQVGPAPARYEAQRPHDARARQKPCNEKTVRCRARRLVARLHARGGRPGDQAGALFTDDGAPAGTEAARCLSLARTRAKGCVGARQVATSRGAVPAAERGQRPGGLPTRARQPTPTLRDGLAQPSGDRIEPEQRNTARCPASKPRSKFGGVQGYAVLGADASRLHPSHVRKTVVGGRTAPRRRATKPYDLESRRLAPTLYICIARRDRRRAAKASQYRHVHQ